MADSSSSKNTEGKDTREEPDTFSDFPALRNDLFRRALDYDDDPNVALEFYFAEISSTGATLNAKKSSKKESDNPKEINQSNAAPSSEVQSIQQHNAPSSSGQPNEKPMLPPPTVGSSEHRKAPSMKGDGPKQTTSPSPSHFSFTRRANEKVGVNMKGLITDEDGIKSEYDALALAVHGPYALVSLRINNRWVPATCSRDALPLPVTKHLLSHLVVKQELPYCDAFSTVGKCKSISDQDGEEFFCVTNSDSPFVAHVFDTDMYESLLNERVRYIRYEQNAKKTAYVFYCYQDNFATGTLLMPENVRHISPRFPGEFGRPDPSRVLELARIAKSYFMEKILNKVKVLDRLEYSYHQGCSDPLLFDQHILAVQGALGGTAEELMRRGRFIKCPTQIKRSTTRNNPAGRLWRETPCFCDLKEVEGCPRSVEVKRIISRRRGKYGHDRNKMARAVREKS